MCEGIFTPRLSMPDHLTESAGLQKRTVTLSPAAEPLVQFLYREQPPYLPVWWEGQLLILPWGSNNKTSRLPRVGWCWQEHLESGRWGWLQPEPVEIPACCGFDGGVWYQVQEGMRGVVVRDEQRQPRVYMLTQSATHYYEIMTRRNRAPVLINQTI